MSEITLIERAQKFGAMALLALALGACAASNPPPPLVDASAASGAASSGYLIGPGDVLQVFVWRSPDLSATLPVRPDGRISLPLIEDMQAAQKTPTQLARDIEASLKTYVQQPVVTVMVTEFLGPFSQQIRVIGEAANPKAIPYRQNISLLDVMIQVGGLTKFASGSRAVVVRKSDGREQQYNVNIDRLLKDGDVTANVAMAPGDVLIIPQSYF